MKNGSVVLGGTGMERTAFRLFSLDPKVCEKDGNSGR